MSENDSRMMGVEIEYLASDSDSVPNHVREYYSGMREVNNLIIPWNLEDTVGALKNVQAMLINFSKFAGNGAYTTAWNSGSGYAYNGVHIHLSGAVSKEALTESVWKLVHKYGCTPRIATSWHIKEVHSDANFKKKRRFRPVITTSFNTTEIRLFDMEYFLNDDFLEDLAEAIVLATKGEAVGGTRSPFGRTVYIAEDFAKILNIMDKNIAPWWVCVDHMQYRNRYTGVRIDYSRVHNPDAFSTKWTGTPQEYVELPKPTEGVPNIPVLPKGTKSADGTVVHIGGKKHFVTNGKEKTAHIPLLLCKWPRALGVTLAKPNEAFLYLGIPVAIEELDAYGGKLKVLYDSLVEGGN